MLRRRLQTGIDRIGAATGGWPSGKAGRQRHGSPHRIGEYEGPDEIGPLSGQPRQLDTSGRPPDDDCGVVREMIDEPDEIVGERVDVEVQGGRVRRAMPALRHGEDAISVGKVRCELIVDVGRHEEAVHEHQQIAVSTVIAVVEVHAAHIDVPVDGHDGLRVSGRVRILGRPARAGQDREQDAAQHMRAGRHAAAAARYRSVSHPCADPPCRNRPCAPDRLLRRPAARQCASSLPARP